MISVNIRPNLTRKKGSKQYEDESKKKPIYQYEYNGETYRVKGFAFKNKPLKQGDKTELKINPDYPTEIYYPWEHGVVDTSLFNIHYSLLPCGAVC